MSDGVDQARIDSPLRMDGKTVLITGAGSGLGRDASFLFAAAGASVLAMDVVPERVPPVVDAIRAAGGAAVGFAGDVSVEDDVAHAVDAAVREYGSLDIMFANAGIMSPGNYHDIEDITEEIFRRTVDVDLMGAFFCCKHAARVMKPSRTGSIVITSSSGALTAFPKIPVYIAAKGGVNALVRALAIDLGRFGIRVNAICPGGGMSPNIFLPPDAPVIGKSWQEQQDVWDPLASPMPLKLPLPPSLRDNANVVLFLASESARYLTGLCIPTGDGGIHANVAMQFSDDWVDSMTKSASQ